MRFIAIIHCYHLLPLVWLLLHCQLVAHRPGSPSLALVRRSPFPIYARVGRRIQKGH